MTPPDRAHGPHPSRPTVVLDARMRGGGVARYVTDLCATLPVVAAATFHLVTLRRRIGGGRAPFTPWGLRAVTRECTRVGADVLHGLHLEVAPVGVPTVVTIHDVIPIDFPSSMPSPVRRRVYRRTLDAALERADRVVVPSQATARALARLGADPRRLRIVPLGAGPVFRPAGEAERERARGRFAGGRPYVVAMSGPRSHKNLAGALAVSERVAAANGPVMVAPGGKPGGRSGALHFLGHLDDAALAQVYAGAEVTLVASHMEGFGLPVLESLACATPVLCGEGIGALPWLRPGVVVVDPDDPNRTAAALLDVVRDGEERERLSAAGRAAAAPLTLEALARATLSVYDELLSGAPALARG